LVAPPPHLSLILKFLQQPSPTTLAATPPHLLFSKCRPSSFGSSSCCASFKWRIGGKNEGGKGGTQGDLEVIYVFALKFNWLYVYLCESVEVMSRIFVGGRTAAVLVVSGDFSWVISGNQ
jgi:hypothetical protein